jgi:hypothetical protein
LNAYFLDYTVDPQTGEVSFPAGPINGFPSNPVFPGNPIGGFYYTGAEDSTFLVGGPADGTTSFLPGNIVTYSGTTTDIPPGAGGSSTPLPSGLALGLTALAVVGLTIRRAWIGDAHQRG